MLTNFPSQLYTGHQGKWKSRSMSPRIWNKMFTGYQNPDGSAQLFGNADDFISFGIGTAKASNIAYYNSEAGAYKARESTSSTIVSNATEDGGVLTFTTAATDNDELYLQSGMNVTVTSCPFSVAAAAPFKPLFFETAIRIGAASFDAGFLAGIGSTGLAAAATLVDDTMVLATAAAFIGFKIEATNVLKFVWKAASQTAQTITLGNIQSATDVFNGSTLTTAFWNNLGFRVSPTATGAKRIKIYVNNVEQATFVTDTNIAAATFPSTIHTNALFGLKNGTAAARTLDLDWWACYQGR